MTESDVIFEWTVHPIADFPKRRWVFLVAVSATLMVIWMSFHEVFWVFFSLVFLLAALNSFVLPTRYRLSESELEIRRLIQVKSRKLSDVRRVDCAPNGFFLSPFRSPSRLENYRGVFLPYPMDDRAEVEAFLRKHIRSDEHLRSAESGS
jgi:hypothetical protein